MKQVAIIHPWLPQYRLPFFERLIASAADAGIRVDVYHGSPPPEWEERMDSAEATYATALQTRFLRLGGRSLVWKSLRPLQETARYDLIVVEQAIRNLETYRLLARTRSRKRLAFWGHGRSYTKDLSPAEERFKRYLTNRGQWFFSYTRGGANAVVANGFDDRHVTIVQNSIDSKRLADDIESISHGQAEEFRTVHGLSGRTALFIGGLDSSKRLDFLVRAGDRLATDLPGFKLLIGGNGSDRSFVTDAAKDRPWLVYLGAIFGEQKALALRASDVLAIPGRVGLVAVDSFAAGRPIVTTDWKWHAPEFEYLESNRNSLVTTDSVAAYAAGLSRVLRDDVKRERMRAACLVSAQHFTIDRMVENFVNGLREAIRR